jgi:hypothetical protein
LSANASGEDSDFGEIFLIDRLALVQAARGAGF